MHSSPSVRTDYDGFKDWDKDKDGVASDDEILSYLGSLNDNSDGIRSFADAVYAQVKDMTADETSNTNNKFPAVDQGHYLIVEKTTAADPRLPLSGHAGYRRTGQHHCSVQGRRPRSD